MPSLAAQQLSSMDLGSEEEEDMEGAVVLGGEAVAGGCSRYIPNQID